MGLIPGSGRSPGGGPGNPFQCSCPENPMDGGAWRATVHGVSMSQMLLKWLSTHSKIKAPGDAVVKNLPANAAEKEMATHSSTVVWKLPWTEEPGGLRSMGSLRIGHDWATSLSLFTFMHRRRKWQSTPLFLPGESQGRGSLVGCRLWGRTELDTTEAT